MTHLKVVELNTGDLSDIPRALRELADRIERGEYDSAHNLAWVLDCGDSRVELGLAGRAPEPAATAHLLFDIAMTRLVRGALGES